MTVRILQGDCLDVLPTLAENSVDACVTDPPYHLTSQVATVRSVFPGRYAGTNGASVGFMGKQWDGGDIAFRPDVWREVYRVLKPGAHLLSFGGTRTYHRMACAIEDAGFEIRDQIQWIYGTGFPKSLDVSKQIDRAAGAEREVVGAHPFANRGSAQSGQSVNLSGSPDREQFLYTPATAAAREWSGFGTALKPSHEPLVLARKPLSEGTVAANVLRWGTGALNIDGCRVATDETITATRNYLAGAIEPGGMEKIGERTFMRYEQDKNGRWPANVIHDGSAEVVAGFPESAGQQGALRGTEPSGTFSQVLAGPLTRYAFEPRGDSGSAARFFYTAKADSDDRIGSRHPTVSRST
jgi:site-specific DNA-methyltransferase (adenine-specific)